MTGAVHDTDETSTLGFCPVDNWSWVAWLHDGTQVREAEDHGWADVPDDRVMAIELVPTVEGAAPVVLAMPEGATAWLGRRRQIRFSPETGEQRFDGSVTMLRWTKDETSVWLYVQDDGRVVVADREIALE